jgi:uncharacterized protein (TIGR03086 family)
MSVELLERAIESGAKVLAAVDADGLEGPTPCASWSVRDLVNHLVGSNLWFAASVDSGVAPEGEDDVEADVTGGDLVAAYRSATAEALRAFRAPGAMERIVKLPFGELPGSVFVLLAANDQYQHAWDLAKAIGLPTDLDESVAAELLPFAQQAIADGLRGPEGELPFGAAVAVGDGASASDRLAAFLGRTP